MKHALKNNKLRVVMNSHLTVIVFNYNQALRNIDLDDYRNASSSCDCQSSTFRYEPHGHVIKGIYES